MNKLELEAKVAEVTGQSKKLVGDITTAVLDQIAAALANGDEVNLIKFGKFGVTELKERTGRNPATGAEIKIAASKKITFKAGAQLKATVNG